jgi:hypothetical protein
MSNRAKFALIVTFVHIFIVLDTFGGRGHPKNRAKTVAHFEARRVSIRDHKGPRLQVAKIPKPAPSEAIN